MPIVLRDEIDTGTARPVTAPARHEAGDLDFGDDSPARRPLPKPANLNPSQLGGTRWDSPNTNDGAGKQREVARAGTARRASLEPAAAVGRANRDLSSPLGTPPQRRVSMLDATPPSASKDAAQAKRGATTSARPKTARPAAAAGIRARTQSQGPPAARPATAAKDRVIVTVRKRPAKESEKDVVSVQDGKVVLVAEPRTKVDLTKYTEMHSFTFHEAFDEECSNDFIYCSTVQRVVDFVLSGNNGTCLAFGQTGSGKTFTMLGDAPSHVPGLMTLSAQELLQRWTLPAPPEGQPAEAEECRRLHAAGRHVTVSMLEIYGDEVFDLLHASSKRVKLIPREDAAKKVRIQGLTRRIVTSLEETMRAVDSGSGLRCTATTGMNEASSRSHAIVQISLHQPLAPGQACGGEGGGDVCGEVYGSLSFVDLAGSEKGSDSANQDKQTRNEGAEINKSLLALKECIRSMDDPASAFTPFRGSKLTLVLRDSFLGQGRIVMLANISPNSAHCAETVNTLRYAHRVKRMGGGRERERAEERGASTVPDGDLRSERGGEGRRVVGGDVGAESGKGGGGGGLGGRHSF
jgi:hypothetical protein